MEKRKTEEPYRRREEPFRRKTALSFHILTLSALLYIILLLRAKSVSVNTVKPEQVLSNALADVDSASGSDVVPLSEIPGIAGKNVGSEILDGQIVDLTESRETRSTSEHVVGADVAIAQSTSASTSASNVEAGNMEISSNCATLEASERVFQSHLKKRSEYYGKDPIAKVEELHSKHRKPSSIFSAFLLELFTPNYQCFPEERIGLWSDGGKWICRVDSLNESSIVYSIGCNGKDDFELELYTRRGCEVHVFDHTLRPNIKSRVQKKTQYKFHDIGLGILTQPEKKMMSLKDMMALLGHTYIDVFKIDCEGCEFEVLPSLLRQMQKPFGQIQVEVHQIARRARMAGLFLAMEKAGYRLFHQEMNWRAMNHFELAFIHEDLCKC